MPQKADPSLHFREPLVRATERNRSRGRPSSSAESCEDVSHGGYVRTSSRHRSSRSPQTKTRQQSPFVFTSERGSPFTTAGFARMLERAPTEAKIAIKVHPHMLRHACG